MMLDMSLNNYYAMAMVNLVACLTIFCTCVCRVTVVDKKVLLRVRMKFILVGSSALIFGISPLWADWPGWASLAFSSSSALGLLAETYQWRQGSPASVKLETMPAELLAEVTK